MGATYISFYLLVLLLLSSFVDAATIYGTVYDLSLEKADDARVDINTVPKQFMVAQNGSYSFNVANGNYIIKAQLIQNNIVLASVEENITVRQEGSYVLDLILFPDIEEGLEDFEIDLNGDIKKITGTNNLIWVFILLLIAVISIAFYYLRDKTLKKEESAKEERYKDTSLESIIKIIKDEGGRTTQKDVRKQIPLSEAKISLMIAELEHKGIIEKIKKGRGNIIILKKE